MCEITIALVMIFRLGAMAIKSKLTPGIQVLGAMVSVLMIWVVTGVLVYMAVLRVISGEFEIKAEVMLITSGLGVLVNIVMGASLHQVLHSLQRCNALSCCTARTQSWWRAPAPAS